MKKKENIIYFPKELLTSKISTSSKIAYIAMLDLYKTSFKNNQNEENDIFIKITIPDIQKLVHCSRPKAIKILKELENNGYIIRKSEIGKSSKTYLVENEFVSAIRKQRKQKKN